MIEKQNQEQQVNIGIKHKKPHNDITIVVLNFQSLVLNLDPWKLIIALSHDLTQTLTLKGWSISKSNMNMIRIQYVNVSSKYA